MYASCVNTQYLVTRVVQHQLQLPSAAQLYRNCGFIRSLTDCDHLTSALTAVGSDCVTGGQLESVAKTWKSILINPRVRQKLFEVGLCETETAELSENLFDLSLRYSI